MSTTSYGLGFEPFPLLLDYELGDHLMLRTDATENALFLGSHMNGNISEIEEALDERFTIDERFGDKQAEASKLETEMYNAFVERLLAGEEGDTLGSLYYSLLYGYSTGEDERSWLQSKGMHLPVVPFSDEPDCNADAVPDLAPWLSEDYLSQVDDLFELEPGRTEDGVPCIWVRPGKRREVRVLLRPEGWDTAAHFQMMLWDWDLDGGFFDDPEVIANARDTWVTDGFLDRTYVHHADLHKNTGYRETVYHLPEAARTELMVELANTGLWGTVSLESEVRVLGSADDLDFELDTYGDVVCKAVVRVG